ncbi:MAG TPA: Na/Pi cotransporter family protein [Gammaproteobacteria bacterium]|nr:Na/Pi cotransporter family protein [Gammaproteobacteria bacterium]
MGMGLTGGLALFLYGMDKMSDALKAAAGGQMKAILKRVTGNRFLAAATGAFVTAIIQSSSITTVLVVGFISANLLSLSQSVGIIMGANIGTTVTAQIVAFKITRIALLLIAAGFAMQFFSEREKTRYYGNIVMGLGLIFFGMSIMSESMEPLRNYQPFLDAMARMENPAMAILVAAVFTALIQSSSATTGIIIVLASQGFVTLSSGIALALGANIGTCVTALLASIGKPRDAIRASVVHVLFNVFGVVLWVGFIPELAAFATWLSPTHPELQGVARMAAETPRQIANANTAFNVVNTLLFIGFTDGFARLACWLVPDKEKGEERLLVEPRYLDEVLVETPALALDRVRLEFGHLGELVKNMLARIKPGFLKKGRNHLEAIARMDDQVDILYAHIIEYLGNIHKQPLSEAESDEFLDLMSATDNLESIGDVIESDILKLGYRVQEEELPVSETMQAALNDMMSTTRQAVDKAILAVEKRDEHAARDVLSLKRVLDGKIHAVLEHQARKLAVTTGPRLELFRVEMELTENVKRIYTLAKRIARTALPKELQKENV